MTQQRKVFLLDLSTGTFSSGRTLPFPSWTSPRITSQWLLPLLTVVLSGWAACRYRENRVDMSVTSLWSSGFALTDFSIASTDWRTRGFGYQTLAGSSCWLLRHQENHMLLLPCPLQLLQLVDHLHCYIAVKKIFCNSCNNTYNSN